MKKFKKYLLMIPLLAVMLLNCVCYGQVIMSASAIDYSDYFKSSDESELLSHFDFTDSDNVVNTAKKYYSNFPSNYFTNYFYAVYLTPEQYNNFISGSSYNFFITCIFTDSSDITDNTNFFILNKTRLTITLQFSSSNNFSLVTSFDDHYDKYFIYYKNTGSFIDENTSSIKYLFTGSDYVNYCDKNIYYYQASNIENFPLFYDYEASQSALNVNVSFSPDFNGEISRTVKANGTTTTLETFNMTVTNNSKFNIQYLMAIYPSSDYFSPFETEPGIAGSWSAATPNGKTYVGNPTYVYVKDEWIYLPHGEQGVITGYAPSSWHYLNAGATDDVTIYFNQLKLDPTIIYEISVYAVRNDYDYVSPYTELASFQWGNDYCIDSTAYERVYDSVFRLLNPATFNPNNNEGSYAFDVDDRLLFNRANGYIDENGEVVIDRVDTNNLLNAGTDPDDPWRGWNDDNSAWEVYNKNQNTVSSDISQLSNNFSAFFKFINKTFSYFPKNYQTTITLGLTAVVVIAILKVVF